MKKISKRAMPGILSAALLLSTWYSHGAMASTDYEEPQENTAVVAEQVESVVETNEPAENQVESAAAEESTGSAADAELSKVTETAAASGMGDQHSETLSGDEESSSNAETDSAADHNSESDSENKADSDLNETSESQSEDDAEDESESETEVRKNPVAFLADEGALVTVDDVDVTKDTEQAKEKAVALNGKIVFTVQTKPGYSLERVLVDGTTPARKNEETTKEPDDYIIEGILSDDTFVKIETKQVTEEIIVTYEAADGGEVSNTEEVIHLTDAQEEPAGSVALAAEDQLFTGWADEDGTVITNEAEFVPDLTGITEDVTYVANFAAVEQVPAQTFEAYEPVQGITVRVSAGEGIFPMGTSMTLRAASDDETLMAIRSVLGDEVSIADVAAVEITFTDENGNKLEPINSQAVQVIFSFAAELEGENFSVIHQPDNGSAELVQADQVNALGAAFEATAFSIYAAAGTDAPATASYIFWDLNDAGEYEQVTVEAKASNSESTAKTVTSQTVKDGEKVYLPSPPEKKDYIFKGWSTDQTADHIVEVNDDNTLTAKVSQTGEVNLYAIYESACHVYFMDESGQHVSTVKTGQKGTTISTQGVTIPLAATRSVTGWYLSLQDAENGTNAVTEVELKDEPVKLYPKVEDGHYIYFYTGEGATYIEPLFVPSGSRSTRPTYPTRAGYTFRNWYSDANLKNRYQFGGFLYSSITVYAGWTEARQNYTVLHWLQNADDDGYTFDSATTQTGWTGSDTNASTKIYEGFETGTIEQKTIAGDGTTIVNVYYNRVEYEVRFYGTYGNNEIEELRIEAKYGADITDMWPSNRTNVSDNGSPYSPAWYTKPYVSGETHEVQNHLEKMPLGGASFYKRNATGEYRMVAQYQLQNLEPENTYTLGMQVVLLASSNNWRVATNQFWEIDGFTYSGNIAAETSYTSEPDTNNPPDHWISGNEYGFNFKYIRNTYTLTLHNQNEETSESYKFEAPVSDPGKPAVPSNMPEDAVFEGWYENYDSDKNVFYGEAFDFTDLTMPAKNLILYAKWSYPVYEVKVHDSMDGGDIVATLNVEYSNTIDKNTMPTVKDSDGNVVYQGDNSKTITMPEGYVWAGWTTKKGTAYDAFNLNTEIYKNYDLYPMWIDENVYKVRYYADENSETPLYADPNAYLEGSYAVVVSGSIVTNIPEGKIFIGWQDTEGTLYTGANDELNVHAAISEQITENDTTINVIKLTPVFRDKPRVTKLTYHSNYQDTSLTDRSVDHYLQNTESLADTPDTALPNNTTVTLPSAEEDWIAFEKIGYEFVGWNTKADGTGTAFEVGAEVGVDNKDTADNILYAQWKEKYYKVTISKTVSGNMGEKTKDFNFTYTLTKGWVQGKKGDANQSGTITLKNGNSADIYLAKGSELTIQETNGDGYTVTYSIDNKSSSTGNTASISKLNKDTTVAFNNHKQMDISTGVDLGQSDPMGMLLILAAMLLGMRIWMRRRKRYSDLL